MSEKDWEKFFDLLQKIVDEPLAVCDKVENCKKAAEENGESAEQNLEEFLSWDFGF